MQTILLLCLIGASNEPAADYFTDVQIHEPYRSYLMADPLLMQVTGAKLIELGDERKIVIAVASVVLESTAPRDRLEAERVCRIKAMAHIIARRNPVQVVHTEQVMERVVISIENGQERAESTSEVMEMVRTRVEGATQELPVVGRWLSRDRSTLYLAVGMIIDSPEGPHLVPGLHRRDPLSAEAASAALGLVPSVATQPKGDAVTVVAEGAGLSPDEALKDAFRNAVRQAVGAYLDPETLVQNDRLVSDRVLTYSNGFVSSYRVLEESHHGGLHRRKIAAVVERRPLVQRLKESKLIVYDLDGSCLAAEVLTRREAERNAARLLEAALEGFPANVLKAEAIGEPKVADARETGPQLAYRVRVSVDPERYAAFRKRLIETLDEIAIHKGSLTAWSIYVPERDQEYGNTFFANEFLQATGGYRYGEGAAQFTRFQTVRGTQLQGLPDDWNKRTSENKPSLLFVINTRNNPSSHTTSWRWFEVPALINLDHRTVRVEIESVGEDDRTGSRDSFVIGPRTPGMSLDPFVQSCDGPRQVVVSPYVLVHRGSGYGANAVTYARDLVMSRKVFIDISRLADVQAIHYRVTMNGPYSSTFLRKNHQAGEKK